MLLWGILHAETGLPGTLGFWISVPIAVLLTIIFTPVETKTS